MIRFVLFLLTGKTGVAIFPAKGEEYELNPPVRIDHFAFQVDQENFRKAEEHFNELDIPFDFQDTYFHSIYLRDPDGHQVELTTLVVAVDDFYEKS